MNRLSPGLKLAYASGTVTFACKDITFGTFLLFYYYQVLGVSGTLAGFALLIAMISDAITDPVLGSLSDQFRSRWGRRHPFMIVGTIPLAITFLLVLNPPDGWSEIPLFLWLTVMAIALRTALTIFFIPYMALGAELSTDYEERTSVTTYRTTLGWVVALVLFWASFRFIFGLTETGEDGRFVESNYWTLAVVSCIMVIGFASVSIFFTRKRIPFLPQAPDGTPRFSASKTITDLWNALRSRNFRIMFVVMLTSSMLLGVLPSISMHWTVFFFELSAKQVADVGLSMIIINLFIFWLMPLLSRRFEKHHLLEFAFIGYGLNLVWFTGLRLLGVLPDNGHWSILALYILFTCFSTGCMMFIHILPASIIADIVDEHEYETGLRQEGVFFAAQGFSGKATSGFGTFFGGWVLDFVKMPQDAKIDPSEVPAEVLFKFGLIVGPILGAFFLIPYLATTRFSVSRAQHAEIQQALAERHEQQENGPAPDEA